MKGKIIKILLATIFIGCALAQTAAAQACQPAPVGLVSAWSGDGNALDARSRSNGVLENGATFAAGEVGQAFSFDGADDQITAPPTDNQIFGAITVEAWINPAATTHGATIVQKRAASNVGTFVLELTGAPFGNPNGLSFYLDAFGGSFVGISTPAGAITPGVWQHVAGTFDGDFLRIYVNGVEVGSAPTNFHSINVSTAPIVIGRNVVNGTGFNGQIDEIGLYNRALSAAEIGAIHNAGTSGKCKPIATNAPDNQVLWLPGDGDALDLSGNGNNGTLSPSGASYTVGKVGQAFRFDGVNGYVDVGTPSTTSQTFTVEGWVRRASPAVVTNNPAPTPAGTIYAYGFGGLSLLIDQPTNKLAVSRVGISGINSNTLTVTDTNWHHVAVTKSGSTLVFYLDGVADTPVTYNETFTFTTPAGIGARADGSVQNAFYGDIDELAHYERALSADEIQSIAGAGLAGKYKTQSTVPDGIAAWYPADGNTNDLQAANNAALQGGATYGNGKVGQAFSFNGTNAYVSAPSTPENDPTGAAAGASMEAWVYFNQRPSDAGRQFYIISKNGSGANEGFDIHADGDNFFKVVWRGSYLGFAAVSIQAGRWYHVVATFDPNTLNTTAGVRFYLNGALLGVSNDFNPRTPSNAPLTIGRDAPAGSINYFDGLIDEAAVYGRVLTEAEIRDQYYAGSGGKYKGAVNPTVVNTAKLGEGSVTFGAVTRAGAVHLTPVDAALFPPLPMGTNTGLNFDVSTSAVYANPTVCFNVSSVAPAQFANLRVFHLEAGAWQNRTASSNSYPNLCTSGLTSLSPFAVVQLAPTAANASIGGRIMTGKSGLSNVLVTLSGGNLTQPVTVRTNSFGYYRFGAVPVGETYVVTVAAKKQVFSPASRVVNLVDEVSDADFAAENP